MKDIPDAPWIKSAELTGDPWSYCRCNDDEDIEDEDEEEEDI